MVGLYRRLHLCVRAMEEEAVGCDEVLTEGEVLGVSPASINSACY